MGRWQILSNKIFCSLGGRPFVNKPFENPFLRDLIKYTQAAFQCRNYYSLGWEEWLTGGINGSFLWFLALDLAPICTFPTQSEIIFYEKPALGFLALLRHVCVLYFIYLYSVSSIIPVVLVSVHAMAPVFFLWIQGKFPYLANSINGRGNSCCVN